MLLLLSVVEIYLFYFKILLLVNFIWHPVSAKLLSLQRNYLKIPQEFLILSRVNQKKLHSIKGLG